MNGVPPDPSTVEPFVEPSAMTDREYRP